MRIVNTAKTWFAARVVMAVAAVPLHASIPRTLEISSSGPAALRSPATLVRVVAFTNSGNLTNRTDGARRDIRYRYDALNRSTNTIYSDGSSEAFT